MKRSAAVLGTVILALVGIQFFSLDGLAGNVFRIFISPDTRYAPEYSGGAFRRVRSDMSVNELTALLGEPLEVWMRDSEFHRWTNRSEFVMDSTNDYSFQYSLSPSDSSYTRRVVAVRDGKVTGKIAEYYLD